MTLKLKVPKISKNSQTGALLNRRKVFTKGFKKFSLDSDRRHYNLSRENYMKKIDDMKSGTRSYLISGVIQNKIYTSEKTPKQNDRLSSYRRNYSIAFTAKSNLTNRELYSLAGDKLREYYKTPRDGFSSTYVEGFSMNAIRLPRNYKFNKNVKMFRLSNIENKLLNTLSEKFDSDYNCVVDYLFYEFQKINKKVNKNLIIKRLSKFCNIEEGVSIEAFEEYMQKHHKDIRYTILSPMFDAISCYKPNYKASLSLVFYVNNSHLYPIQDQKTQSYINQMLARDKKYNFSKYFEKKETTIYSKYKYMDIYDEDNEEEDTTYIMNKNMDINQFCISLIDKTNTQPSYIDLNHKTGSIQSFKHPTKEIVYQAYDDYEERKTICEKINKKYDNQFIRFTNQSHSVISKTLINYLGQLPKSDYIDETFDYLNKYEPKPIIDVLKTTKKNNVLQLDYYKQYSSIFYNDFEKLDIKIPIYDFFNTVEEYNDEEITYGEYFVKQKKYKGVKVFGCFLNYKIVELLLKDKYIKKDDITHCITTQKFYTPKCFKEFVEITSELSESEFKKVNNILNGSLKGMFSRKSRSYFTNDINSVCYIYNESVSKNLDVKWQYNDQTKYHFIKTIKKDKILTNTSSFYRTTLSCSILQTLKLIKKVSEYGDIVKVLTDAVYYKPKGDKEIKDPKKSKNIIKNLGKCFHDSVDNDLEKRRQTDIVFEETPIEKNSVFISGAGGLGKTYSTILKLKEDFENTENQKILFTSHSNDATLNLQDKIFDIIGHIPQKWKISTLCSFFQSRKRQKEEEEEKNDKEKLTYSLKDFDLIVVDEIFTAPSKFIKRLEMESVKKIYLGDEYQLPQIFNTGKVKYQQEINFKKYFDKYCNIETKEFVEGKSRYDKKAYKLFEQFKKYKKTANIIKNVSELDYDKVYKNNIAFTNKRVFEINTKCCEYFHKDGEEFTFCLKKENFPDEDGFVDVVKENKKKFKYKIGVGCPIRCETPNKNLKKNYSITTGWRGEIIEIEKHRLKVKGVIVGDDEMQCDELYIEIDDFTSHFTVAYCMTCHKWQGRTIQGEFAIYDTKWTPQNQIKLNHLYTAFTRTGTLKNIHIDKKNTSDWFSLWKPNTQPFITEYTKKTYNIYILNNEYSIDKSIDSKFYKTLTLTKNQIKTMLNVLNYNLNNVDIIEEPIKQVSFKPLIKQTNRTPIINVFKNRIKCLYYDVKEEKTKIKDMKPSKKRNLKETYNKMLELFPNAKISDKNNLVVSFA